MSDFAGMEELLQDFLTESSELLSDVDNKLVELEKYPEDKGLLNDIFRGFHTIKGGAGFLNATPLVTLCHRTENLFDKLRNGELQLNSHVMDVILDATGVVRDMFGDLAQSRMPAPAPQHILDNLDAMLAGQDMVRTVPGLPAVPDPASVSQPVSPPRPPVPLPYRPDRPRPQQPSPPSANATFPATSRKPPCASMPSGWIRY